MRHGWLIIVLLFAGRGLCQDAARSDAPPDTVLVTVNGHPITQAQLEAEFLTRQTPPETRDAAREAIVEDLIDRTLIAAFLSQRKIAAPERELEAQWALVKRLAGPDEGDFAATLERLGLTEASLRAHLALPLAWKAYVRRTVTDEQVRNWYAEHRAEFDGTEVRASQIVISVPEGAADDAWSAAEWTLRQVRADIAGGKITFADAAKMHSTSPSGQQGGDLGIFAYRGRLPVEISAVAFALQPGEISEPFRTRFGVHLLTTVERKPGDLSLEDARAEVLAQMSGDLWRKQAAQARSGARIERRDTDRSGAPR